MQASDDVMEGIISVSNTSAWCLFDSYSTQSYVVLHFASKLWVAPVFLDIGLRVATPVGVSIDIDVIYRDCIVQIEGRHLLDIQDFDVILGMDWLAAYRASVAQSAFQFQEVQNLSELRII